MRNRPGRGAWRDLVRAVACALVACFFAPAGVEAAESVASNLDLMAELTSGVASELCGKLRGSLEGRAVRLKPHAASEDYVFVTNVFTTVLTGLDVTTLQAPTEVEPNPAPHDSCLVLEYQMLAFGVTYPKVYRSHLVGGKRVEREAAVRVLATLTRPEDGAVAWVGEASRQHEDEFDFDELSRVERGTYQFARPTLPSHGWGKFAEPVFVTGIIVGLIYLFFSNQSNQ